MTLANLSKTIAVSADISHRDRLRLNVEYPRVETSHSR